MVFDSEIADYQGLKQVKSALSCMVQIRVAIIPIYQVVERGAESVLHKVPIVVGNLMELNHHTLSVLPSSHKGIGVDC